MTVGQANRRDGNVVKEGGGDKDWKQEGKKGIGLLVIFYNLCASDEVVGRTF
jgi:hypothetical protein